MEQEYRFQHASGLTVVFVPKPGFQERYAMFTVKYGSADLFFQKKKTGEIWEAPAGIAHFLEHKLFEQPQGSVDALYAKLGARPNAFTSTTQTSYLFSCASHFEECLRLLLHYVQNPYLTPENVEMEKGIIGQEINMYLDNPDAVVYMNMLRGLYQTHPVRNDIAGSIESISAITPEVLYAMYHTFYTPDNMVLVVVGDEDPKTIESIVNESVESHWVQGVDAGLLPVQQPEATEICQPYTEKHMEVYLPQFMVGYKDTELTGTPLELCKKEVELQLLHELLFGKSSDFYEELYNAGLINDSFYNTYELERGYAFSALGGESKDPKAVMEKIANRVAQVEQGAISKADFQRVKNSSYGSFVKRFNSVEGICRLYTSLSLMGVSVIDYFSLYDKIDFNSVLQQWKHFDVQKATLSVVR